MYIASLIILLFVSVYFVDKSLHNLDETPEYVLVLISSCMSATTLILAIIVEL